MTTATPSATHADPAVNPREGLLPYVLLGAFLGVVFVKAEVVSWFRIQEMFRFQSFHMYGIIGSAVAVGAVSVFLLRRLEPRTLTGDVVQIRRQKWQGFGSRYWLGGTAFGLGWGLLGACPGPIYVLLGTGMTVMIVALAAALAGAWTYGALRSRLPHT